MQCTSVEEMSEEDGIEEEREIQFDKNTSYICNKKVRNKSSQNVRWE